MTTCKWKLNKSDELHDTGCGIVCDTHHEVVVGGKCGIGDVPFKFCPYCGKEIEIVED